MFLLENSVGAHGIRVHDFGGKHDPFCRYGRVEANSRAKEPNFTNINEKGPPNHKIALSLNNLFLLVVY